MKYLNDTQTARLWSKIKAGFVSKSGDTMTGALTLAGDPVSDLQAATKKYVDDNAGGLPSQTGQSGKFLTTDGTDASWAEVDALPSQTGKSGKFLTTDGTDASWEDVDSLPSQTGQSGKYLTTNGTSASWATVDALPSQSGKSGKYLSTNGTTASWEDGPAQTAKIWTGYCTTASDVVPKVVVLDDPTGFSLDADNRIAVRFYNGIDIPSTENPALNVNDTGNKKLFIPTGIIYFVDDRDKLICARGETCLFTYNPGLGSGGWILETSGLLLSKTYDIADAALPKAGGTMTGALTLSGAPTSDLHAATKKYVDDNAGALPSQTGQSGKFLTTDGTDASWADPLNVVKPAYELSINDNVATVLDSSLSAVHFLDVVTSFGYSRDVMFTQHEGYYTIVYELFSVESDAQSLVFINLDGDTVRIVSVTETNDGLVGTYSTVSGQSKITASGLLKGDGNGGVTAAVAGTDYLKTFTETDPTVPSWAKQSSKPSYTASEVGAVPTTRTVNGKTLSSDITLSASDVSALPSSTTIPTASTTNPSMDGTASYGSGTSYARSNHVHPTDTSRQAKITASGLLKGDGSGGVSAATAGTDYAAASHSHGNITSGGDITATAPTIASGDQLVINDNSASKITNGPTFDGSTTTKALTPKGTWETFLTLATLPIYDGTVV